MFHEWSGMLEISAYMGISFYLLNEILKPLLTELQKIRKLLEDRPRN
jgi:hypothetical protein